jgi:fructuronate reductase
MGKGPVVTRRLSRRIDGRPLAPVRAVHLGLGNFFRAHQAWYTDRASDAAEWGIAAFSGRSVGVTSALAEQEFLYTLTVKHPEADRPQTVSSLSDARPGTDVVSLVRYLAQADVTVLTTTITEAGYYRGAGSAINADDRDVAADIAVLSGGKELQLLRTAPAKILAGLAERRRRDAGPITLVPCDNLPHNAAALRTVLRDLADRVDPGLASWLDANVGFITTMVDRITPRITEEAIQAVEALTGVHDPAAVVTEPFSEWVLSGDFVAPRPAWETAGAQFVPDVAPFEQRKLWLLNGSHSLMAYAATVKGHATVCDAIGDPVVLGWVNQWWDVAARHLALPASAVDSYREALLDRYRNPNIRHLLSQIAADGSVKLPIRIVPALLADLKAGGIPTGAERAVAAWVLHLRGRGAPVNDVGAEAARQAASGPLAGAVAGVCDHLGVADRGSRDRILELARELGE